MLQALNTLKIDFIQQYKYLYLHQNRGRIQVFPAPEYRIINIGSNEQYHVVEVYHSKGLLLQVVRLVLEVGLLRQNVYQNGCQLAVHCDSNGAVK